ncbi:hypothetical protein ACKEU1_20040 [Yersinia enterocolitica]
MLTISYAKACSTIFLVITTTAATVWYARADYIEQLKSRIDAYEKSSEWELPDTLNKLSTVSTKLSLTLDEKERLNKSEKQLIELNSDNIKINKELKEKTADLVASAKMVDALVSKEETFSLVIGDSHPLIKNEIFIALKSLMPNKGYFSFKNQDLVLYIGEYREYEFGNKKCKVLLTKIAYKVESILLTNTCS